MKAAPTLVSVSLMLSFSSVSGGAASEEQASANRILETTGVKGGFVVHLGCGTGRLTAALRANDGTLVHGLDTREDNVRASRQYAQSTGLYGAVSIDRWDGKRLPYVDNLVSLVVAEHLGETAMDEVMRVLAPGGAVYARKDGKWTKTIKRRPDAIDEWTHYLHDASNNAVSHDALIGPPRHLQWVGSPRWTRHHDRISGLNALVSASGRVFYVIDEGPRASVVLPPKWSLVARDGFNGVVLWKLRIDKWHPHLWPLKNGPAQLPRRLVAVGDRVYVTLGLDAPVSALDAATGRTVWTCESSQATEELIASKDVLFLLVNRTPSARGWGRGTYPSMNGLIKEANRTPWDEGRRRIMAVRADTGDVLWDKEHRVVPLTLAANYRRVFFHDGEKIVCLDRKAGDPVWSSKPLPRAKPLMSFFGPTLVVYRDVILFAGGEKVQKHRGGRDTMTALSAKTGEVLWTSAHPPSGYDSPEDVLVADGLVWTAALTNKRDPGAFTGRDPKTGEIKREFAPDQGDRMPHHRCHRAKATDRFILASRTGTECIDVRSGRWTRDYWVRGTCLYGIMPANGLTYAPPHSCACYILAKLNGFNALASESSRRPAPEQVPDEDRLQRGPAFDNRVSSPSTRDGRHAGDWPTYRHDSARSGFTPNRVPVVRRRAWGVKIGGRLSSPVIAGGKVFVSSVNTHTVHALDVRDGKPIWRYTVGGRVDSPPTIHRGRVLFGSADGWVYCLAANNGALIWRFRAAPMDRRLVAYEQIESVWPVHGSVLVRDDPSAGSGQGVVYCVAGRSMFLDGGLRFLRLDVATGRKLSETILNDRQPNTGRSLQAKAKWPNLPVALPDVLSSDAQHVYMRSQPFDFSGRRPQVVTPTDYKDQTGPTAHLFCPTGFLDDTWWHRTYWIYGKSPISAAGGWHLASFRAPTGRVLAFDESSIYGFGRRPQQLRGTPVRHHLFAASKEPKIINVDPKQRPRRRGPYGVITNTRPDTRWSQAIPLLSRAMVLAAAPSSDGAANGRHLFIAGPPDVVDQFDAVAHLADAGTRDKLAEQTAALEGKKGGALWTVAAADGKKLGACKLDSIPVFDGMAAASGRLFLSQVDGRVICMVGE